MATLLHAIKNEDLEHPHGERSVATVLRTAKGKQALVDFMFSPNLGFYWLFGGLPTVDLAGGLCRFTGLSVDVTRFPVAATHFRMQYFVVDFDTAFYSRKAVYVEPVLVSPLDLSVALPSFELAELGAVSDFRVAFLHVQFCQFQEGVMVDLTGEGMQGLRCLGVFSV